MSFELSVILLKKLNNNNLKCKRFLSYSGFNADIIYKNRFL